MECKNCKAQLADNSAFCTVCGQPVNAEPAYSAQPNPQTMSNVQPSVEEEKSKDPGFLFGLISLVCGIFALILYIPSSFGPMCCSIGGFLGSCIGAIPAIIATVIAAAGIVFAVLANKKSNKAGFKNTLAKIGMIVSAVTAAIILIMAVIFTIYVIFAVVLMGGIAGLESLAVLFSM